MIYYTKNFLIIYKIQRDSFINMREICYLSFWILSHSSEFLIFACFWDEIQQWIARIDDNMYISLRLDGNRFSHFQLIFKLKFYWYDEGCVPRMMHIMRHLFLLFTKCWTRINNALYTLGMKRNAPKIYSIKFNRNYITFAIGSFRIGSLLI